MKTSDKGAEFIQQKEGGFVTKAYKDSGGIWTIGAGHIENVKARDVCTVADAQKWLHEDLRIAEKAVNDGVKVELKQNEFDALVSFTYNVGVGAFAKSTLLRRLNAGDKKGAADQFKHWNHVGSKVVQGLTNRRNAERELFLNGSY